MSAHTHEPLDAFLGAWLHQDCCMNGETLQDIVADYRAVARDEDRRALRLDIEQFLKESEGQVDSRLEEDFDLDIIPSAFAADAEDFLRTIHRLLDDS
jgi:CdiI immunity protein